MATKKYQKPLPKPSNDEADDDNKSSGFVETDSWINGHGKAVYINVPEKDIIVTVDKKYGNRLTLVTSLATLKRFVDGEIQGVPLSRFKDD